MLSIFFRPRATIQAAFVVACAFCLSSNNGGSVCAAEIHIAMRDSPRVPVSKHIAVADVATVSGASPKLRKQIENLDLETNDSIARQCLITRRQVEMRVKISGLTRTPFRITGPERVTVECGGAPSLARRIERQVAMDIARQFAMPVGSVSIRLENNLDDTEAIREQLTSDDFTTSVVVPAKLPLGRTQLQVEIVQPDGNRFFQNVPAHVIATMPVALSTQALPRGTVIDESMFQIIDRSITRRENFASPKHMIGMVTQRDVPQNHVMLSSFLANRRASNAWTVKRNDVLDVIVDINGSQIRLKNARALSSANKGEQVTVLNTRSNKQLSAVVVSPRLAKVSVHGGTPR